MFACKACKAKDAHMLDLKEEIKFLRAQLYKAPSVSVELLEANKIMEGAGSSSLDMPEYNGFQLSEMDKIKIEADRILTGAY